MLSVQSGAVHNSLPGLFLFVYEAFSALHSVVQADPASTGFKFATKSSALPVGLFHNRKYVLSGVSVGLIVGAKSLADTQIVDGHTHLYNFCIHSLSGGTLHHIAGIVVCTPSDDVNYISPNGIAF